MNIDDIVRRAVAPRIAKEVAVSVLTDVERRELLLEEASNEASGSGGASGFQGAMETLHDDKMESLHRRAAVLRSKRNRCTEQRRRDEQRAAAKKAKKRSR
jgi:hypothetical protein